MNVTFTPPRGFVPPETSAQGAKSFDLVCTFEAAPGGQLRLTKLGDTDMAEAGDSTPPEAQTKPDYSAMSQGIMGGMAQTGLGQTAQ